MKVKTNQFEKIKNLESNVLELEIKIEAGELNTSYSQIFRISSNNLPSIKCNKELVPRIW